MISVGRTPKVTIEPNPVGPFNGHPTLTNQLLAAYRCQDNAASSVVLDATAASSHATAVFAVGPGLWVPVNTNTLSDPAGKLSPCLKVNGGGGVHAVDYTVLEGGPGDIFEIDKPFSLAGWVSNDMPYGLNDVMFSNWVGGTDAYFIRWNGGLVPAAAVEFYFGGAGGNLGVKTVSDPAVFPPLTWFHIGVSYDGSVAEAGMKIFFNGFEETIPQGLGPPPPTIASPRHHFGSQPDGLIGWNGRVQQGLVWDRVVTPSEFNDLYNGGNGLAY
jgi:hypothetical protein